MSIKKNRRESQKAIERDFQIREERRLKKLKAKARK
jgi:hypothetical protein